MNDRLDSGVQTAPKSQWFLTSVYFSIMLAELGLLFKNVCRTEAEGASPSLSVASSTCVHSSSPHRERKNWCHTKAVTASIWKWAYHSCWNAAEETILYWEVIWFHQKTISSAYHSVVSLSKRMKKYQEVGQDQKSKWM